MTTVTIAEARDQLPDLLKRAAAGEQIEITDGGSVRAALAAPPVAEDGDEAAAVARRERLIRDWLNLRSDAPLPKPDAMTHEEYYDRYRKAE